MPRPRDLLQIHSLQQTRRTKELKTIFFLTTHFGALRSFAAALRGQNVCIQVPDETLRKHLHYGYFDALPDAVADLGITLQIVGEDHYFNSPPDMLLCTHPFLPAVMHRQAQEMRKIKPVVLCGYTQGFSVPHDLDCLDALIAIDYPSYIRALSHGIPTMYYWPWIDFDYWQVAPIPPGPPKISMFCNDLIRRPEPMPTLFDELQRRLPAGAIENFEWRPTVEVRTLLNQASATLSLKPNEGYGYAVLESLASGRPVFAYRPLLRYQTYLNWLIDGATCIFFDTADEFVEKYERFAADESWRTGLQRSCADVVRRIIDNDLHSAHLRSFIGALLSGSRSFTPMVPDTPLFRDNFLKQREIWNILSGKMWWDPIAKFKIVLGYDPRHGMTIDLNRAGEPQRGWLGKHGRTDAFKLAVGEYEIGILPQQPLQLPSLIDLTLASSRREQPLVSFRSQINLTGSEFAVTRLVIDDDDDDIVMTIDVQAEVDFPQIYVRLLGSSPVTTVAA